MPTDNTGPQTLTRRRVLRLFGVSGAAMALAACTAAPAAPTPVPAPTTLNPQPTAQPTAAAAQSTPVQPTPAPAATIAPAPAVASTVAASVTTQPKAGGTFRLGMVGDISMLDGHIGTPAATDTIWSVYDRLTAYNLDKQPQPQLAESWDLSPDLKQIKLSLRRGVQFHSGRELTSDDITYNLMRVRDPQLQLPTLRTQSNWFTGMDTPDKYTVVLTSEQPRPLVFDMFEYFNILDRDTMEGPDAKVKAVGTGPFKFVEWVQGDHLAFVKNPNYWQTGKPYVDAYNVSVLKDAQAMLTQFEAGALDLVKTPPLQDMARYRGDPKYQTIVHPASGNYYLFGNNLGVPPLDNKLVRQALNYAIDRKRFVETIMLGFGQAESLPWLPGSLAYEAAKQTFFTFDPDKARGLLQQAGVSSADFDLNILSAFGELVDFGQIYQADLAQIGITLNVRPLELATWVDEAVNRKYRGLYLSNSGFAQLDPSSALVNGRATDPAGNNSAFQSDQYSQLISNAASEPDANKRQQIYSQLNDLLLDESFIMVLAGVPTRAAARASVHDVGFWLRDAFDYTSVWLG
jgi:peptide/nickel transport system substrate-binding protein